MSRPLYESIKKRLNLQAIPVFYDVIDQEESVFSATALWNLSLETRHAWRKQGVKAGDVIIDQSSRGLVRIRNLLAALIHQCRYIAAKPSLDLNTTLLSERLWFVSPEEESPYLMTFSGAQNADQKQPAFKLGLFTSGTTSLSQTLYWFSEEQILRQLETHNAYLRITPESGRLCLLPGFHAFGLVLDQLLGLYAKQTVFFNDSRPLRVKLFRYWFETFEIDYCAVVPRQLELLLDPAYLPLEKAKTLTIHTGGAVLPEALQKKAEKVFKRLHIGYGLTECGPGVMMDGIPIGCFLKLLPMSHENNELLYELKVKTPCLGEGEKTKSHDDDGYYDTGDVAIKTECGGIEVLGRKSGAFKSTSGEWINDSKLADQINRRFGINCAIEKKIDSQLKVRVIPNSAARMQENFATMRAYLKQMTGLEVVIEVFASPNTWSDHLEKGKEKSPRELLLSLEDGFFKQVA